MPDNQHNLTAGKRGAMLLEDVWLFEKMSHLNRELIPERRMHAKGFGAHGHFRTTADISHLTRAKLFAGIGQETPVFVRFSTAAGERAEPDATRDVRGFAVKFYTPEGNWDLVGNNTPVFFLREPGKFADLNHVLHRHPRTGRRSNEAKWDFWTRMPEAFHQVTITMSERGIPDGFRHMHGFGSHTFSLISEKGVRTWVKFHWVCQQGIRNLTDEEAARRNGADPDNAGRDLFDAIERGDYPRWKLCIQTMSEEQAQKCPFHPFDLTKVWPHGDYPLQEVGILELNRNPENYFAEVEQAAFNPGAVVPGIGFSPDKMLQARLIFYSDAQHYRLGINHHLIPINKARNSKAGSSFHRDGRMRTDDNAGSTPAYEPNSSGDWQQQPEFSTPPSPTDAFPGRWDFPNTDEDYFGQARALFLLMGAEQRAALFANTARALDGVSKEVVNRHVQHCFSCHPEYGSGVENAIAALHRA